MSITTLSSLAVGETGTEELKIGISRRAINPKQLDIPGIGYWLVKTQQLAEKKARA